MRDALCAPRLLPQSKSVIIAIGIERAQERKFINVDIISSCLVGKEAQLGDRLDEIWSREFMNTCHEAGEVVVVKRVEVGERHEDAYLGARRDPRPLRQGDAMRLNWKIRHPA